MADDIRRAAAGDTLAGIETGGIYDDERRWKCRAGAAEVQRRRGTGVLRHLSYIFIFSLSM